jgi:hypothetical protein
MCEQLCFVDLDYIFSLRGPQLQLAKMFLTKENGVSLRTIARLVVLVYFVAELASKWDGRLQIGDSSDFLSVRAVEEKLHRNRIR